MARPAHVPNELIVDLDLFGGESIDELLAKIEEWRKVGPVLWSDHNHGHWVALSAEAVRAVLSDPKSFSSAEPRRGTTLTDVDRPLQVPIEMDGTEHRQYRRLLIPLFSPVRVQVLEATVREMARSLIAEFAVKGSCDVVADFARPLASGMFMQLMDWPLADRSQLEHLADLGLNGPPNATPAERSAAKLESHMKIAEYVTSQITRRREGDPGIADGDMTTVIMNSTLDDGVPIADDKLVGMLRLLLFAGLDTTQSVLSQSLYYLSTHPEAQQHLRSHRDEIPRAVEEFLRWTAPANPSRTATVDCEIGGVRILKGDTVLCMPAAADRDAAEFDEPGVVDLTRKINRHIAFSAGPHKCIGSALARVVLAAAVDEFHQAVDTYQLDAASSHTGGVWGMNRVDIVLEPAGLPA